MARLEHVRAPLQEQHPEDVLLELGGIHLAAQDVGGREQMPLELGERERPCHAVRGLPARSRCPCRRALFGDALDRGSAGSAIRLRWLVAVWEQDRELIRNGKRVDHRFAARAAAARPVPACAADHQKLVIGEATKEAPDILSVRPTMERAPLI